MRAGAGLLLVMLGLFVIFLGVTGKLTRLSDALGVLMGKSDASPLGAADGPAVKPAGAVPFGVNDAVAIIPSIGQLFGNATAVTPLVS